MWKYVIHDNRGKIASSISLVILQGMLPWWPCWNYSDGLMQERRNSIANALELRLSCINPSTISYNFNQVTAIHLQFRYHPIFIRVALTWVKWLGVTTGTPVWPIVSISSWSLSTTLVCPLMLFLHMADKNNILNVYPRLTYWSLGPFSVYWLGPCEYCLSQWEEMLHM